MNGATAPFILTTGSAKNKNQCEAADEAVFLSPSASAKAFARNTSTGQLRLLHHFFRHRSKRDLVPASHPMRRDDDHIRIVVLGAAHQFHPHVVRRAHFRARFHVFLRERSSQLRKALRSRIRQTLVVLAFLQYGHIRRQILDRRHHMNQQQLRAKSRRKIRSHLQRRVR